MSHRASGSRVSGSVVAALALSLLACAAVPGVSSAASRGSGAELVVYSARAHYDREPAFEAFTARTGLRIRTLAGAGADLVERLRAEGARSPADVLLTVDAGTLGLAARAGLLQRADSPALATAVPAHLRDPGGRWVGLTVRARTLVYHPARVRAAELSTYEALGEPRWKGRLCLRTSTHPYSQSLLAVLAERHGVARTEAIAAGWTANQPIILQSDTKVLEAIAAGRCDVGIANTYYLARLLARDPSFPVRLRWANQATTGTHVNVSGAGVTTHSPRRADAVRLLEYLASPTAQQAFADANFEYPVNPRAAVHPLVAAWGTFRQDDTNLAAVVEQQAAAVRLADRAGYR